MECNSGFKGLKYSGYFSYYTGQQSDILRFLYIVNVCLICVSEQKAVVSMHNRGSDDFCYGGGVCLLRCTN